MDPTTAAQPTQMDVLKTSIRELEIATRRYNKAEKEANEKLAKLADEREAARAKVVANANSVGVTKSTAEEEVASA